MDRGAGGVATAASHGDEGKMDDGGAAAENGSGYGEEEGGRALFTNPECWMALMPGTKAARWQRLGGVDFRLQRVRQQQITGVREGYAEDTMEITEQVQALVDMGVYEPVPQTEEEESQERHSVQAGTWDQLQTSSRLLIRSGRLQSTSQSLSSKVGVTTEANAIGLTSKQDVRRSQRRARQLKDAESQLDTEATVGL